MKPHCTCAHKSALLPQPQRQAFLFLARILHEWSASFVFITNDGILIIGDELASGSESNSATCTHKFTRADVHACSCTGVQDTHLVDAHLWAVLQLGPCRHHQVSLLQAACTVS